MRIETWASAVVGLALLSCAGVETRVPAAEDAGADAFLVVDCLLPSQLRKLGTQATFVAPRRPIKTSASDCGRRGGEYVAPGGANVASSLAVWLPAARAGDARAQNVVGEIYERGEGASPDYELAAVWYRRSADQADAVAMQNLGRLYEEGRGIARDPGKAIAWYRQASGLEGGGLDFIPSEAAGRERQALEEQNERQAREIDQLRARLAAQRQVLRELERARSADVSIADAERAKLESARRALEAGSERLARERAALEVERAELDGLRGEARTGLSELEARSSKLAEREAELATRRENLDRGSADLDRRADALTASQRTLAQKESEVAALSAELAKQTAAAPSAAELPVAGPTIQVIEPPIPVTRGVKIASSRTPAGLRTIVGRVEAPAGLLTLTVNGRDTVVSARGLFRSEVEVTSGGLEISIAAVDHRGERAERRFRLAPRVAEPRQRKVARPTIDFGSYHALVIGNNRYRHLPSLSTAIADATRVGAVLEARYGFEVQVLLDADRYQVLSALNGLRATLNEDDNLLVYYAGHGELDQANQRGHWLPVDAEPDSSANWISNIAITDTLNAMTARHIMIVADSCYSGTLTRSSLAHLGSGKSEAERDAWIRAVVAKRSRTALTSGGLEPVMDSGGGVHSVFAQTFIEVLESNTDALDGQRLFREVAARVTWRAANLRFDQVPQYAPIKFAGHESGDFFLTPVD